MTTASLPCLDENALAAMLEQAPNAGALAELDAHVAGCDPCRARLAAYAHLFGPASQAREEPSPPANHSVLRGWLNRHGAAARVGTIVREKWTIDQLLGAGGMGYVYAATHRNGRRCALKVLRPELAASPPVVERFLREGYAANKVGHPGAVAVLDDDRTDDGAPFLVMELLEGETLAQRRARAGALSVSEVFRVADDVLDVLATAHAQGIVHRDIKPDNIFVTREGVTKVLDFGIARLREVRLAHGGTDSGSTLGTPAFMPPEQALGRWDEVDARSDLWALGATMHMLITGRPVRTGTTDNEALLAAMTRPVIALRDARPDVPPAMAAVVDRALAFDRASRWPDARAMQRALREAPLAPAMAPALGAPAPSPAPAWSAAPAPRPQSSGLAWILGALAAGLLFVGALGGATAFVTMRSRPVPIAEVASPARDVAPASRLAAAEVTVEEPPARAPDERRPSPAAIPRSAPAPTPAPASSPPRAPVASAVSSPPGAPAPPPDPMDLRR